MSTTRIHFTLFLIAGMLVTEMSSVLLINTLASIGSFVSRHVTDTKPKIQVTRYEFNEAIHVFDDTKREVRFNLAPTYGNVTSKSLQMLDESLRVMMYGILEMDIRSEYNWKELMLALDMNMYVKKQSRYSVSKIQRLKLSGIQYMTQNSQKSKNLREIRTWFSNLIGNADILQDTSIDIDSLSEMMSDVSQNIFSNIVANKVSKKALLDMGILRFPDVSKPFFSIYRINLIAEFHYKAFVIGQVEYCNIFGLFQREVYYPDEKYIGNISRAVMDQVLSEVDDLFSDL